MISIIKTVYNESNVMEIKITPFLKRRFAPVRNSVKRDLKETYNYYSGNAIRGWNKGEKYAVEQSYGLAPAFFIKAASAALNTRVRGKDVLPFLGCGIFSFTNPVIGMGLVGYALGKSANKFFSGFCKGIKLAVENFMPKIPPNSGLG